MDSRKIADWMEEAHRIAKAHGFHEDWNNSEKIALIHSEASELLEELREPGADIRQIRYRATDGKPEGAPAECADIAIRLFDFCAYNGINLEQAIKEKMMFNDGRPFMHGKNF